MLERFAKFYPDPELRKRWFNFRWFVTFNIVATVALTPLAAAYQFHWRPELRLSALSTREWLQAAIIGCIPAFSAFYLIGDGWVYFRTRRKLREQRNS